MSVSINIDNVVKKYGDNTVIKGLSLHIRPGEFFTLLGPSGCGKTTLLRMIIGFNSIEGGTIKVDDTVINDIPVNKRNMGMVFQNYAIFPHMSVAQNVAFGLKQRNVPKDKIDGMVDEILKVVKIDHLKKRMPTQLSGGQQQRVALARAIVIHPQVLLMDEPLSNLDAKLRVEMRNAIKHIQQQIGITTVYVTHDQEEALAVSDRIAVMHDGVIQQVGSPKFIYQRPANRFVSNFIGLSNFFKATLRNAGGRPAVDFGSYSEAMDNLDLSALGKASAAEADGSAVTVAVRPEEFFIRPQDGEGMDAVVQSSVFLGIAIHYFMTTADGQEVEVIKPSDTERIIPNGTAVKLGVDPARINVFTEDGMKTLIRSEGGEA
ncbi:MAG: ABC transporter ATP-binding protein [Succiniclasticum sp.]|nr:ABC transporter ATP-binding protein [Succiniclasticum sp.]MEE3478565.1 ABC transporter ATP-binding protein [Succiniclasticum sp.]